MLFGDNGTKAAEAATTDLPPAQSVISESAISSGICWPLTLHQMLAVDDDRPVRKGGR